ncbi:MAG: RtcB family protein [Lachnospiraceae bacterium]|nr:RtcB family protein [Lachnospiraceae bacterium]
MKTIEGIYTSANIFATSNELTAIDNYAIAQIQMLCNNEALKDCLIRVMPDVHPGIVGTIGLTMTIGKKLMPNLIGIDIGCGMTLSKLKCKKIEFQKLDAVIRENVPSGFSIRNKIHHLANEFDFTRLKCYKHIREEKALLSLGTLGGGNHFIEADKDEEGYLYVVIHSGSRNLGKEVTEYYLNEGQKELKDKDINIPYELTYLEGEILKDYLHDIQVSQEFASLNREIILAELVKGMKWKVIESYKCIHNYIDNSKETIAAFHSPILRKGAISAKLNEKVIIPINMRDGIILGTGLGNTNWNCSAPHGSGRLMKREDIKSNYTVSAYKSEMKGIYSSCINKYTLDEAPFAYRRIDEIVSAIKDTVIIDNIIKPIYNYKAGGN